MAFRFVVFFVCSNKYLFAAIFLCLQQHIFICSCPLWATLPLAVHKGQLSITATFLCFKSPTLHFTLRFDYLEPTIKHPTKLTTMTAQVQA